VSPSPILDDPTAEYRKQLRAEGFIGRSEVIAEVLRKAAAFAPRDDSVLLFGGPGLGKKDLARIIHHSGPRASAPFVEVCCAALPDALVDREVFGANGDGTGGRFEAATGGTLVLAYVDELPPASQETLLGILRSKKVDARVLATCHYPQSGRLKEGLLHLWKDFSIRLPRLSERREDIAELFDLFCTRLAGHRYVIRDLSRHERPEFVYPMLEPSDEALRLAEKHPWMGGIREFAGRVSIGVMTAHQAGHDRVEAADMRLD
jgi:DNA-binding NtrC family response regulator